MPSETAFLEAQINRFQKAGLTQQAGRLQSYVDAYPKEPRIPSNSNETSQKMIEAGAESEQGRAVGDLDGH